ncbi:hypothetical protein U1763_02950 [Sphingomonas sp. LB2R24]|uniref:hypothetical protein n=1 Tax=Sphingomonas sorbitolis TaxID=3096165 RepID=UPI002FC5CB12
MTVALDGYRINLRDLIGLTAPFIVTAADLAAQPALLPVGIGGQVQYFTNGFRTRTQGVDVVGTYRTKVSDALLKFSLAYYCNDTKVTDYDARIISVAQLINAEKLAPRHRVVFNANWSPDNLSFNVRENYHSSFTSAQNYGQTNGVANQPFDGEFTIVREMDHTIKYFTLSVGAQDFIDGHHDRFTPS